MKYVLERAPGLAGLDIMERVVGGEEDERLEGEEHPGVVSQQLGQECRAGAPGGWTKCSQGSEKILLDFCLTVQFSKEIK